MNGRIMIVEDEGLVADDLASCIQGFGYEVVGVASSVETAESLVDTVKPDLVLLDIQLRGKKDGIELAGELRKKQIGFVYLTAHSDQRTLDRAEVTEPLGYVLKPFGARDMLPVLKTALYRHSAEKHLRGMETWLSTTLRSIGDGVMVTDLEGRITYVNPVAERIIGQTHRDVIGREAADVLVLVAADGTKLCDDVAARAIKQCASVRLEPGLDLVRSDGSRVGIDDCASPVCDDSGKITGAVVVFRDDSERRRVEQRRREADQRMHEAEKLESLGVLAGGLAHDLNNVLTAILGNVAICRLAAPTPAVLDSMQQIEKSAHAAAALCNRMLSGVGAKPLTMRPVEAGAIVNDCIRRERVVAGGSITIQARLERPELFVVADELQLNQLLSNLIRNAVEAMCGSGGTITVRSGAVTLPSQFVAGQGTANDLPAGEYVWFEVADEGPGMAPDVRARVFEPFFTTKTTGRGLGLANVSSIVRRHGGAITCESESGCGTVFRFFLPAAPPQGPGARVEKAQCTVLVVDDDDAVRLVTSRLLGTRSWKCHEASSGDDALRQLRAGLAVDAVVLDVIMPGTSSKELVAAIRAIRPDLPLVMTSGVDAHGLGDLEDIRIDFMMKPFVVDELIATMDRLIRTPRG